MAIGQAVHNDERICRLAVVERRRGDRRRDGLCWDGRETGGTLYAVEGARTAELSKAQLQPYTAVPMSCCSGLPEDTDTGT